MFEVSGLRHQSLLWRGFESHSFHFIDISRQSIVSLIWTPAHGIFYNQASYWQQNIQAGWPRDMRRWFKAPVSLVTLVRVQLQLFCWHSFTNYCFLLFEHLHMVSSTIIHAIEHTTNRQNGAVVYVSGLRHQSFLWRGFESNSCHFDDILTQSIVSFILNTCTWYLLSSSVLLTKQHASRMAEWSKALL